LQPAFRASRMDPLVGYIHRGKAPSSVHLIVLAMPAGPQVQARQSESLTVRASS
jgi:hypothetical protein